MRGAVRAFACAVVFASVSEICVWDIDRGVPERRWRGRTMHQCVAWSCAQWYKPRISDTTLIHVVMSCDFYKNPYIQCIFCGVGARYVVNAEVVRGVRMYAQRVHRSSSPRHLKQRKRGRHPHLDALMTPIHSIIAFWSHFISLSASGTSHVGAFAVLLLESVVIQSPDSSQPSARKP